MEQTPVTSNSPISLIPAEILSIILCHAMRSETSVDLERFVQVGRRLQDVRDGKKVEHSQQHFWGVRETNTEFWFFNQMGSLQREDEVKETHNEDWFLNQIGFLQGEHFQDWLMINSTCRGFRKWGKKAFFSEKVFMIQPAFLKSICDETTKVMSAANVAIARERIRHVIVPLPVVGMGGQFITLPRYHALKSLRSINLQKGCAHVEVLSNLKLPGLNQYPLPKELESLLRAIGLRVDQLQMDLQMDEKCDICWGSPGIRSDRMHYLNKQVYPCLRVFAAIKAKVAARIRP